MYDDRRVGHVVDDGLLAVVAGWLTDWLTDPFSSMLFPFLYTTTAVAAATAAAPLALHIYCIRPVQ